MKRFLPDMYQKNILSINYKKLKDMGIKTIIFDFDNTLMDLKSKELEKEKKDFLKSLKEDFNVVIISNTFVKSNINRLQKLANECNVNYIVKASKPLSIGYKRAKFIHQKEQIAMIGDQLLTDIWGAKRMGYLTVLVDPIHEKEIIFTKINRFIENRIIKRLNKINNFERGKYYE